MAARKAKAQKEVLKSVENLAALDILKAWEGTFTHAKIVGGKLYLAAHTATFEAPFEAPDCQPDLDVFARVMRNVGAATCSLLENGNLRIVSDRVTATVQTHDQPIGLFRVEEGAESPWNAPLLPLLATLRPFLAFSPDVPWKGAICFDKGFATVCTGSLVVQVWAGAELAKNAPVLLPLSTVDALLAIGREPCSIRTTDRGALFDYGKGVRLATGLYAPTFPDLESVWPTDRSGLHAPAGLADSVSTLGKVSGLDLVRLHRGRIVAESIPSQNVDVSVDIPDLFAPGVFVNRAVLADILKIASTIKFFDGRLYFEGANLRGVVSCGS